MRSRIWTHRSGTPCPGDALSNGRNIREFSFGDASVRDTLSRHPSLSVTGAAGAGLPVGRIRIRDVAAKVQETLALQGGVQVP
jgi:hypothetical protein